MSRLAPPYRLAFALLSALMVADALTTWQALRVGAGAEANPAVGAIFGALGLAGGCALKALVGVGVAYGLCALTSRARSQRSARSGVLLAVLLLLLGAMLLVVTSNLRIALGG